MYARGIVTLFPYLSNPFSKNGYEHYYDGESGTGYLAWRIKTIQSCTTKDRRSSFEDSARQSSADVSGGPTADPPEDATEVDVDFGRKRPGKVSATQAEKHLVVFKKSGTSIQEHLDAITTSTQPCLLAVGVRKNAIHQFIDTTIIIDKNDLAGQHLLLVLLTNCLRHILCLAHHTTPCSTTCTHSSRLLCTNIDVGKIKESLHVAKVRARLLCYCVKSFIRKCFACQAGVVTCLVKVFTTNVLILDLALFLVPFSGFKSKHTQNDSDVSNMTNISSVAEVVMTNVDETVKDDSVLFCGKTDGDEFISMSLRSKVNFVK
ncbi:hypothetical protein L3Q82_008696 [Scortum barcoo]|uniref:Uncharacterized protein n=1 Tax=Scortum barcoo TaxID=214431 RepID=A0ACB8XBN1_9TELE|nr:hypothetical protein L3Q82_008696 [Scortum barcoo]